MPKKIPTNDLDERRPGTWAEWQRYEKRCEYVDFAGKCPRAKLRAQIERRANRLKIPEGYPDWLAFTAAAQLWKEGFING